MNTSLPNLQRALSAGFASVCVFFISAISHAQTFDPSIFDGSHTVVQGTINQQGNGMDPTGDWQSDSLTVYGPDGQNPQPFGVQMQMPGMQGMQGMQGQQGGMGSGMSGMGLPPLMGGGGGGGEQSQQQSMQGMQGMDGDGMIPPGMEGNQGQPPPGAESSGQPPPGAQSSGQPPPGAQSSDSNAQASNGEMSGGESGEPPPDMQIGDSDEQIAQAQQQAPQDQGQKGEMGESDAADQATSQDSTKMPSASGKQSGKRGAGVEEGDAMPADL